MNFNTKEELKNFIQLNAPLVIYPKREANTKFVSPWASNHGRDTVIDVLASKLWQKLNEKEDTSYIIDGDI